MNKLIHKMVLTFAGGMLAVVCVSGSSGYFKQDEVKENVFTVGDLELSLKETDWDPEEGDGVNVYPGYTVYKNPTVKNVGQNGKKTQPCYMQVRVCATDEEGNQITDPERLELIRKAIRYDDSYDGTWEKKGKGEKLIQGRIPGYSLAQLEELPMINPEFEEKNTENPGEWLFCYKGNKEGIFEINEEAVLFTDVVIPNEWSQQEIDKIGIFQLDLKAEAVQAAGFKNQEEAMEFLNREVEKGGRNEE